MIGWYAHHHGSGHVTRARAVRRHLRGESVLLTSAEPTETDLALGGWKPLPRDDRPQADPEAPGSVLHYAPVGHGGFRARQVALVEWIAHCEPDTVVVDVSVETTLVCRLLGIAPVVVRQHGRRTDRAHRTGFDAAGTLVAPWPAHMESDHTPAEVAARTHYVGWASRYDDRAPLSRAEARDAVGIDERERVVTVMVGSGDDAPLRVADMARRLDGWHVVALGTEDVRGDHLTATGRVAEPWPWLCAADVVLTSASQNCVAEALAAGRPLVAVPQPRPFDEQHDKAAVLRREGVATTAPHLDAVDHETLLTALAAGPVPLADRLRGAPTSGAMPSGATPNGATPSGSRAFAALLDVATAGPGPDVAAATARAAGAAPVGDGDRPLVAS